MDIIVTININQVVLRDPLKINPPNDSFYIKSLRYMGKISQAIETLFEAEGFKLVARNSAARNVTYLYKNQGIYRKLEWVPCKEEEKDPQPLLKIILDKNKLASVLALLKQIKVPNSAIKYS